MAFILSPSILTTSTTSSSCSSSSSSPFTCSVSAPIRMTAMVNIPNSPSELFRQQKKSFGGRDTGVGLLERPVEKVVQSTTPKVDPGKPYKVLLFDDKDHSKEYVVKVLMKVIPGMTMVEATTIMETAHSTGSAVVGVWIFEVAEMYCDLLRSAGLVSDIRAD